MICTFIGGTGSKKSEYAEDLAVRLKKLPPVYLAAMINASPEDEKIVQRHRALRQGKGFVTVEKPARLYEVQLPECDTVLLEDVPNLAANEIFSYNEPASPERAYSEIIKGIDFLARKAENLIVVTGNVFEDGNIYDEAAESYLKILGEANMHLADISDVFAEIINGYPLFYKGSADYLI